MAYLGNVSFGSVCARIDWDRHHEKASLYLQPELSSKWDDVGGQILHSAVRHFTGDMLQDNSTEFVEEIALLLECDHITAGVVYGFLCATMA